jgi:sugar O-acyltransferase (sialic acid O-acetyltransferase NeuD family)
MKRLLIIGGGGHGKVVAETAIASGAWETIAFLDGRFPRLSRVMTWPVIGTDADTVRFVSEYPAIFLAIGDNGTRSKLAEAVQVAGYILPTIVHPAAWVSSTAHMGAGTVVVGGAVVNAEVMLGKRCIVNTGATVDHECQVGDDVHISPGVHIGGGVTIGKRSWIGIGAVIRHGVTVGSDVIVGAGAAVVKDVRDGVTVTGVPARQARGMT